MMKSWYFQDCAGCIFLKLFQLSFVYLVCWIFIVARRLSLVVASRGLLIIAVPGLLTAVTSLVAEHRL